MFLGFLRVLRVLTINFGDFGDNFFEGFCGFLTIILKKNVETSAFIFSTHFFLHAFNIHDQFFLQTGFKHSLITAGLGIETESVSKHNVRFVPEHFWKRERFLKTRFETQKSFLFLSLGTNF